MDYRSPAGFDRTRNAVIGHKDFDLTYLGTEWWINFFADNMNGRCVSNRY